MGILTGTPGPSLLNNGGISGCGQIAQHRLLCKLSPVGSFLCSQCNHNGQKSLLSIRGKESEFKLKDMKFIFPIKIVPFSCRFFKHMLEDHNLLELKEISINNISALLKKVVMHSLIA